MGPLGGAPCWSQVKLGLVRDIFAHPSQSFWLSLLSKKISALQCWLWECVGHFWVSEATVQISVMGQKQVDQKAVIAHSYVRKPCTQLFCRRAEGSSSSSVGHKLGNLSVTIGEGESHGAKEGLKGVAMLWKFKERRRH